MPDAVDPWVMHRIYKSCKFRTFQNVPTPCGIKKYMYFCKLDDSITNHVKCDPCTRCVEGESEQTNKTDDQATTKDQGDGSYL